MTLNDLRDWHRTEATLVEPSDAQWHLDAVTCLDYAIEAWDRQAAQDERRTEEATRFAHALAQQDETVLDWVKAQEAERQALAKARAQVDAALKR
jgi:hypothetical protein